MNLPAGVTRSRKSVKSFDAKKDLDDLSAADFSGYVVSPCLVRAAWKVCRAIPSRTGMGAVYEYYGLKQTLNGDEAVVHVMNGFLSVWGVGHG